MPETKKELLGTFELSKEHKSFEKDGSNVEYDDLTLNVKGTDIKILIKKEDKRIFDLALEGRIK